MITKHKATVSSMFIYVPQF